MSVKLSADDLAKLVGILQKIPGFDIERDRRRILAMSLGGSPLAENILSLIDLGGPPMLAASAWLTRLAEFGQVEYGKESLGIFLNAIVPYVDAPTTSYIRDLFVRYPLSSPVAQSDPISSWEAGADAIDVQEKIVGENTFYHIYQIRMALAASRAVVHIDVPGEGLGTGFMIGPDLLMTNEHVLESEVWAKSAKFSFAYELSADGSVSALQVARCRPNGLFVNSKNLDYAIVQLEGLPDFGGPLKLSRRSMNVGESLTIIGHPNGAFKKISLRNNAVHFSNQKLVQYTTSTEPGSSGSPVLENDVFSVVALHSKGGDLADPATRKKVFRNQGSTISAILNDLEHRSPEIHRILEPSDDGQ